MFADRGQIQNDRLSSPAYMFSRNGALPPIGLVETPDNPPPSQRGPVSIHGSLSLGLPSHVVGVDVSIVICSGKTRHISVGKLRKKHRKFVMEQCSFCCSLGIQMFLP
jgi:hypothetical protein